MIVHIIDDEKFLLQAITLFESVYPNNNFFLVGTTGTTASFNNHENLSKLTQVIFKKTGTIAYLQEAKERSENASLLIFHNLYKAYKLKLIGNLDSSIKMAWTFWGAELYGLNPKINNLLPLTEKAYFRHLTLKLYVKKKFFSGLKKKQYWKLFNEHLKTKLDYTLSNIREDIDRLDMYSENRTKSAWFSYYSFNEKVVSKKRSNEKTHILIGNSSTETNNHFDTFELLASKDLSGRKLYIPLNYGDVIYRDAVIKKASYLFGEQAEPIVDFLKLEEYSDLIGSCSVLLMNTRRQQAFNTIMIAMANGCKIYLREENTIYPYLKRKGFVVFSIAKDFNNKNSLDALDKEEQHKNIGLIKKLYGHEAVLERIKAEVSAILNE